MLDVCKDVLEDEAPERLPRMPIPFPASPLAGSEFSWACNTNEQTFFNLDGLTDSAMKQSINNTIGNNKI